MTRIYPEWTPPETFGARVQRLRQERGWSLNDLAERSGTVKSHIHQIESGKSEPSLRYVVLIARAFEMEPAILIAGLKWVEYER